MAQGGAIRKFVCPEIVYGPGALKLAGQYIRNFGAHRVFVVSDPGVVAAGWTGQVIDGIRETGVETILFASVSPNPRDIEVMKGAEEYRHARCDAIVAVGGGSPMDCAKGIGIVSSNRCNILECQGVDRVERPMPPLICIPTTAGSSADVSQFAIITDSAEQAKVAIVSKSTIPDVALIDPLTTTTMDSYLTACTGMDALVHAIEAYVSNASSAMTDLHALHAIRLITADLVRATQNLHDLEARDKMMMGSLQAGLAFSNASLGAVHAMAHSLGGLLDLTHGESNALLLEQVIRFNFPAVPQRFREIAATFGVAVEGMADSQVLDELIGYLARLRTDLGIANTLGLVGVTARNIPHLARKAMHDACMVTNPRRPTQAEIESIYEKAI